MIKINEENANEDIAIGRTCFYNLDLSNNYCINKNIENVKLIINIIDNMTLHCLDISHILYGKYPSEFNKKNSNEEYLMLIGIIESNIDENENNLKTKLIENQKEYVKTIGEINCNEVDINKLKNKIKNKELFENNIKEEISKIIEDEKSNYSVYLKEQAKNLIYKTKVIKEMIIKDNIFNHEKYVTVS